MDAYAPILLLAGGELFLAAIGLRIAVWVLRGWREWGSIGGGPGGGSGGPRGGLRVIQGGAQPEPLRKAA